MTIQSGYTKAAADNWDAVFRLVASDHEVDFWRIGDRDLQHELDDSVEEWLEGWATAPLDQIPKTVEVEGYRSIPKDPPPREVDTILYGIYERLDDEFGDPDGCEWTDPPEDIRRLATEFLTKVYRSYGAADAKLVCKETVDVQQWVRDNRPDWLEP